MIYLELVRSREVVGGFKHPLTARVVVNRYWQMLFGRGIVKPQRTSALGATPSHQDLLDFLVDFMESGWDVKHL